MGRLRVAAALEKNVTTRVQTRLLKQANTLWKLQSPWTAKERARAPPSSQHDREPAQTSGSSNRNRSKTHNDNECSENLKHPRSYKFAPIEDITDLVQKQLDQASQQTSKGIEHSGLRPSNSPLSKKSPCFNSQGNLWLGNLRLENLRPPPPSPPVLRQMAVHAHNNVLLCRAFSFNLKGSAYHWFYSLSKNSLQSFDDITDAFYNQLASLREF